MYCKAFIQDLIRSHSSLWWAPMSMSAVRFLLQDQGLEMSGVHFYCIAITSSILLLKIIMQLYMFLCECSCVNVFQKHISKRSLHRFFLLKHKAKCSHYSLPYARVCWVCVEVENGQYFHIYLPSQMAKSSKSVSRHWKENLLRL